MAFKVGAFSLSLTLAAATGFAPVFAAVFALAAVAVYLTPLFRTFSHPVSYALLALLAGILGSQLRGAGEYLPFTAAVGVLAYLILALKELHLVERTSWHYLATLGVWYLLALTFFSSEHANAFPLKLILAALASFLLWREFFRSPVPAAVTSMATAQLLWVISTLPLTMVNSTNLAAIAIFSITDLMRTMRSGNMATRNILLHITTAVFIGIAIFFVAAFM